MGGAIGRRSDASGGSGFVHGTRFKMRCSGDGGLVVESRSGRRIEVGRGFDSETLQRLLTILDKV